MRLMKRNCRSVYYCLYEGRVPVYDESGNETGDTEISYSDPVELKCNVSPATGQVQTEMFGVQENYDKVIVTDWMDCPIDENSVLFVDTAPEYGPDPEPDPEPDLDAEEEEDQEPEQEPEPEQVLLNHYDYVVKRVAKNLNHIAYGILKVKVS